jgi:hypothetical protein
VVFILLLKLSSLFLSFLVENLEQFDASRSFLKELDVVGYVWIGLMRPGNADKFTWP